MRRSCGFGVGVVDCLQTALEKCKVVTINGRDLFFASAHYANRTVSWEPWTIAAMFAAIVEWFWRSMKCLLSISGIVYLLFFEESVRSVVLVCKASTINWEAHLCFGFNIVYEVSTGTCELTSVTFRPKSLIVWERFLINVLHAVCEPWTPNCERSATIVECFWLSMKYLLSTAAIVSLFSLRRVSAVWTACCKLEAVNFWDWSFRLSSNISCEVKNDHYQRKVKFFVPFRSRARASGIRCLGPKSLTVVQGFLESIKCPVST